MTKTPRETELVATFVEMADTLVAGYDIVDLLHRLVSRTVEIVGATDAGIHLRDEDGRLRVAAVTSERSHFISLLELDAREGPCLDAFRSGRVARADDIAAIYASWPEFAVEAGELGYASVYAIPLRLRDDVIGSLNIFRDVAGPLSSQDMVAAQGLADVATIGILHQRALHESEVVRGQLQAALDSRVLIEQAKGVVAQTDGVDMDEAFRRLRDRARSSGRLLSDVAREVAGGTPRGEGPAARRR